MGPHFCGGFLAMGTQLQQGFEDRASLLWGVLGQNRPEIEDFYSKFLTPSKGF